MGFWLGLLIGLLIGFFLCAALMGWHALTCDFIDGEWKKRAEQRCAFCKYKCGENGSYKLEICGEEWFYCSDECIRRDLGIDDKKWSEIEKHNPAPLYFDSGRFGGMITKLSEIEKE